MEAGERELSFAPDEAMVGGIDESAYPTQGELGWGTREGGRHGYSAWKMTSKRSRLAVVKMMS